MTSVFFGLNQEPAWLLPVEGSPTVLRPDLCVSIPIGRTNLFMEHTSANSFTNNKGIRLTFSLSKRQTQFL